MMVMNDLGGVVVIMWWCGSVSGSSGRKVCRLVPHYDGVVIFVVV